MWQICAFKLWAKTMGKLSKRHLLRKSWRSYGWKPWKLTAGEIVGVDGEARHRRRRKNHSRGVQIALQRGRKMRKTSGRGQQNSPHQKISVIVAFLKVLNIVFYCRINYIIVEVDTDFLLWNYRKRFQDITQWIFVRHLYDIFTTFNYVFTAFKVTWTMFWNKFAPIWYCNKMNLF